MIRPILLLVGLSFWTGNSAASFVNLDFEDYSGSGNDLLPGWTAIPELFPGVDLIPLGTSGAALVSDAFAEKRGRIYFALHDPFRISQRAPENKSAPFFLTLFFKPSF